MIDTSIQEIPWTRSKPTAGVVGIATNAFLQARHQAAQQDEFAQQQALREQNDAIERQAMQQRMQLTAEAAAEKTKIDALRADGMLLYSNDMAAYAKDHGGMVPPEIGQSLMGKHAAKIFASNPAGYLQATDREERTRLMGERNFLTGELGKQKLQNESDKILFAKEKMSGPMTQVNELDDVEEQMRKATDPAVKDRLKIKAERLAAALPNRNKGMSIGYDNEGRLQVSQWEGNEPTIGMKTNVQESLNKMQYAYDLLDQVKQAGSQGNVGIAGAVIDLTKNRVAANFFPDLMDKDVADAKTVITIARQAVVDALKDSSRYSTKAERESLLAAIPSPEALTSAPNIQAQAEKLQQILNGRMRTYAGSIGAPPPLKILSNDELKELVNSDPKLKPDIVKELMRRPSLAKP